MASPKFPEDLQGDVQSDAETIVEEPVKKKKPKAPEPISELRDELLSLSERGKINTPSIKLRKLVLRN